MRAHPSLPAPDRCQPARPSFVYEREPGAFTNRSRWRPLLLLPPASPAPSPAPDLPPPAVAEDPPGSSEPAPAALPRRRRTPWAELLRRVLAVEASKCPQCSAPIVVLAFLTAPRVVARILTHLGLPTAPSPVARARDPFADEPVDFDPQDPADEFTVEDRAGALRLGKGRAPPGREP